MRVLITCHSSRWGGGVSVAKNLLYAFAYVAPENEYAVTIPCGLGYEALLENFPRCRIIPYAHRGSFLRWWWETTHLPKIIRDWNPDVVFNMANRGITCPPCPQATLIQDPHFFYPFKQFGRISLKMRLLFIYHRRHLRLSLKRTQVVFCQTDVARDRFLNLYGSRVDAELCPNHFSIYDSSPSEWPRMPAELVGYKDQFILFVLTRYYTHKNLEIIPELFRRFKKELCNVMVLLTISHEESSHAKKLLERVRSWKLEDRIITVGPLRQDQLFGYYVHTDCLFLPSLLESFSGTYIEAMRYGRPIITSDMDFARAVCGEAAEYFDPRDPKSICSAILRVRDSQEIRNKLIKAGNKRQAIGGGSWEETARNVINRLITLVNQNNCAKLNATEKAE